MMTQTNMQAELLKHEAFVRRIAGFLLNDPNDVDDLTQDVWVSALQRKDFGTRDLRDWLASTVRSMVGNRKRSEGRRAVREREASSVEEAPCPLDAWTARQVVVNAVLALDEPFRSTVIWAYGEGLSTSEIAKREKIAEGTVRSRLFRAHAKLREDLGSDSSVRSTLSMLLLAPLMGGERATRYGAGPTGASAVTAKVLAAVAIVAVCAVGGWMWHQTPNQSARLGAVGPDSLSAASQEAPLIPKPALVPPTEQEDLRKPGAKSTAKAAGPSDHKFWKAVRAIRERTTDYSIVETEPDSQLRRRLKLKSLKGGAFSLNMGTISALRALQSASGVAIEISDAVLPLTLARQLNPDWVVPSTMSVEHALNLILGLAHDGLGWEVRSGAVHVAPWQELLEHGVEHTFDMGDLGLDPADYFAHEDRPSALFPPLFDGQSICDLLRDHDPELWTAETAMLEADGTMVHVRATPRVLLTTQRYLNNMRRFLLPLPKNGTPGRSLRLHRVPGDRRLLRALAGRGGVAQCLPKQGTLLGVHLKHLGKKHRVGVLWTMKARANSKQLEELRFTPLAGCLIVHARQESVPGMNRSEDWIDMRPVITDLPVSAEQISKDTLLASMGEDGEPMVLNSESIAGFLRQRVQPDSWDEDMNNKFMIFHDQILLVTQKPWVLDEIQGILRFLADE